MAGRVWSPRKAWEEDGRGSKCSGGALMGGNRANAKYRHRAAYLENTLYTRSALHLAKQQMVSHIGDEQEWGTAKKRFAFL